MQAYNMVTTPTTSTAVEHEDFNAPALPLDRYDEVPEGTEEVDGELIEKIGVAIVHRSRNCEYPTHPARFQQPGCRAVSLTNAVTNSAPTSSFNL